MINSKLAPVILTTWSLGALFYSPLDVGIFVCCLISVYCRVMQHRRGEAALREGMRSLGERLASLQSSASGAIIADSDSWPAAQSLTGEALSPIHRVVSDVLRPFSPTNPKCGTLPPPARGDSSAVPLTWDALADLDLGLGEGSVVYEEHDPVALLLSMPDDHKIQAAINWLSVISNCLTYYLRPSQVLYTFLFNNADFLLYVMASDAAQRRRSAVRQWVMDAQASRVSYVVAPSALDAGEGDATVVVVGDTSGNNSFVPAMATGTACHHAKALLVRVTRRLGAGAQRSLYAVLTFFTEVCMSALDFVTAGLYAFSNAVSPSARRRGGSTRRRLSAAHTNASTSALESDIDEAAIPSNTCSPVSWLLLFNTILLGSLVLFHYHNLLFSVGAASGYAAACGILFLCGKELTLGLWRLRCIAVGDSGRQRLANTGAGRGARDSGPSTLFLVEHIAACGCSLFYCVMLLDEGEALYATHVECVRWYVATIALGLLEAGRCAGYFLSCCQDPY